MLEVILIIAIFLLTVLTPLIVLIWKKKNYVKELYSNAGIVLLIITMVGTIGLMVGYFVKFHEEPNICIGLMLILGIDIINYSVYIFESTRCIYLQNDTLIKKNIFYKKQIKIDKNTTLKVSLDREIIKSQKTTIIIRSRYVEGDETSLINKIKELINN